MPITKRWRLRAAAVTGAVALAMTLAACTGTADRGDPASTASSGRGGTLTLAVSGDVANMDTANCVPAIFCTVAYDTLTHISPKDGSIGPSLATEWKWTDDTRTVLRLTLRDGVTFADGTPVTGEAVAASFTSYLSAPGPFAALAYPFKGAAAAGEDQVDITFAEPLTDEYALYLLSGQSGLSYIVSPAAAADRSIMVSETHGGGPYVLDPSQTTKGVKYTYVPNKNYYNQDAITYDKVVYQPMQDPAARLNAIRSGQVSSATNISTTDLATVESAGLNVSRGPLGKFATLALSARDSGPLADVRVRQALAYATPSKDIASALYGESATPTSSFIPEGAQGYNDADTDMYAYNVDKAKKLLADAGYAGGFTITTFDPAFFDPGSALGQALKAAYAEVGVTLELVPFDGSPGDVALKMGDYDSVILSTGANGISGAIYTIFRPNGGLANPKNVPLDEGLLAALKAAATTSDVAQQKELSKKVTTLLDELVYAVPVAGITTLIAVDSDVQNVPKKFWTIEAAPFSPITDEAWKGGGN